ncbi:hypothetical protein Tco_0409979 [Tanacetum coccineum]
MENRRMILNSVQNGPLVWHTVVQEDGTTRTKKYEKLSVAKKLQADCLPPDIYAIFNHHKVAKEIWDRGETLYQYYWRFAQLINNTNVINLSMRYVQVNIKFLNSLLPEWSKFVMDVKLARDLHTTKYDQLYSYLEQHEAHANETRLMRERYQNPLAFVANYNQPPSQLTNYHSQYNTTQFPQQTNTMILQVHSPQSYSPMYLPPHLSQPQIIHSSIPLLQQYQSHMDHQTSSVPPMSTLYMDSVVSQDVCLSQNVMLPSPYIRKGSVGDSVENLDKILDEEQLAFLADPGIPDGQAAQITIPNTVDFQTDDLDAYDSNYDDVSNAKAIR